MKKAHCQHPLLAEHRINFYADRMLLMLAAWRGRVRVVRFLLKQVAPMSMLQMTWA